MKSWMLMCGALLATSGCKKPPRPVDYPPDSGPRPEGEKIGVDLADLLIVDAHSDVLVPPSKRSRVNGLCKLLVARVGAKDALEGAGATAEDTAIRALRRAIMLSGRDVIASEVAARVSQGSDGSAVARYREVSDAEKLLLLAGGTNADALLVIEKFNVFDVERVVELHGDGTFSSRPKTERDEKVSCRDDGDHQWLVQIPIVGMRAKLVNLEHDDPSILADIDRIEGVQAKLPEVTIERYRIAADWGEYCGRYKWAGRKRGWRCASFDKAIVGWERRPQVCKRMNKLLDKGVSKLEANVTTTQLEHMAQAVVAELFETKAACGG